MATTVTEETNLSRPVAQSPPGLCNLFPDKIDRFLDVIAYSPGGEHVFVGASSLSTTLWKGSAWLFNPSYFTSATCLKPAPANCLVGIVVETGVSSAVFLDNSKLLFGCDSGALRFNEVKDTPCGGAALKVQLQLLGYSNEHSCTVSDLDVLEKGNTAVSCSQDCSIKVWDVTNLVSEHTYSPAHVNPVTGVKRQPNSSHSFASTSLDGTALFWDIRQSKPASCLHKTPSIGLTALTWCGPDKVVVGSVSGQVSSLDIRKLSEPCDSSKFVSRPVHRLESCPQNFESGKFNVDLTEDKNLKWEFRSEIANNCERLAHYPKLRMADISYGAIIRSFVSDLFVYEGPSLIAVCQDSSIFTVIKSGDNGFETLYQDNRHADFVRCATWHPTTMSLLTCSWDSTISSHEWPSTQVNGFDTHNSS